MLGVVRLRDLIEKKVFSEQDVLVGVSGLDRTVSHVVMGDVMELGERVTPGSLIFLSETVLPRPGESAELWFKPLLERGAAGLVVKLSTPRLPQHVTEVCRQFNLPIIKISVDQSWVELLTLVMRILQDDTIHQPIRERFVQLILSGGGIHTILEEIRCILERPVIYYDNAFKQIDHSGRLFYEYDVSTASRGLMDAIKALDPLGPWPRGIQSQDGVPMIVQPIQVRDHTYGYLILQNRSHLSEMEGLTLRHAAEVIGWQCFNDARKTGRDSVGRDNFFTELLLGSYTSRRNVRAWAAVLGVPLDDCQVALTVTIDHYRTHVLQRGHIEDGHIQFVKERLSYFCSSALEKVGNKGFVSAFSDSLVVVLNFQSEVPLQTVYETCKTVAEYIQRQTGNAFRNITVTIGIGEPIHSPEQLAESFRQARQAVRIGQQVWGKAGIYWYRDLGLFRLLDEFPDKDALRRLSDEVISPLLEHDRKHSPPLLPTLRAFLAADGDRKRAAEALYIHANTVSYRLQLIEDICGLSAWRTEDLFTLQLALKIRLYLLGEEDVDLEMEGLLKKA